MKKSTKTPPRGTGRRNGTPLAEELRKKLFAVACAEGADQFCYRTGLSLQTLARCVTGVPVILPTHAFVRELFASAPPTRERIPPPDADAAKHQRKRLSMP